MKLQSETAALDERIRLLQLRQKQDLLLLREQAHLTYESLKPINLIKGTFQALAASPEVKSNAVNILFSLATGFLSKRILMGTSNHPLKRIVGTLFQLGIANVVSKHSDAIKLLVEKWLLRVLHKEKKPEHEFSSNGHKDGNWDENP